MKRTCIGWLSSFILALCLHTGAFAQEEGIRFDEKNTWPELLALSAKENKLIFLDCYTTWCGPCKGMAKDVFPLPEVGSFMNANFINTKRDMEKGEGVELQKKYKKYIPGYPTYLLINGAGEVVHQVSGYNAATPFIEKMKDGLQQKGWLALEARYRSGERGWAFLESYLAALESGYQKQRVGEVVQEVLPTLRLDSVSSNLYAYKVFRKYWSDVRSPIFTGVASSPGIYRRHKDSEKEVNEWAGRLYKRAVDSFVTVSTSSPEKYDYVASEKMIADLRKLYPASRENLIALMLMSQAVARGKGKEFLQLTEEAWNFGLLRYNQREVTGWARSLASRTSDKALLESYLAIIRLPEQDQFTGVDEYKGYAYILEKLGRKQEAQTYLKKASDKEAAIKARFKELTSSE